MSKIAQACLRLLLLLPSAEDDSSKLHCNSNSTRASFVVPSISGCSLANSIAIQFSQNGRVRQNGTSSGLFLGTGGLVGRLLSA